MFEGILSRKVTHVLQPHVKELKYILNMMENQKKRSRPDQTRSIVPLHPVWCELPLSSVRKPTSPPRQSSEYGPTNEEEFSNPAAPSCDRVSDSFQREESSVPRQIDDCDHDDVLENATQSRDYKMEEERKLRRAFSELSSHVDKARRVVRSTSLQIRNLHNLINCCLTYMCDIHEAYENLTLQELPGFTPPPSETPASESESL